MAAIWYIIDSIINLWVIVLFVTVIASWLVAFGVVNRHNQFVDAILRISYAVTEPVLRPIRRFMPNLGGIDLSPIVAFILARAIQIGLGRYIFGPAMAAGY